MVLWGAGALLTQAAWAQAVPVPLAIVPLTLPEKGHEDQAAKVTGALEVTEGKAMIANSGVVSSGSRTTEVVLPHRGVLRVCAATTVKLAADKSVPAGDGQTPGLMMAMDHGAIEASFATGRNSDVLLTPDFRILISGPGAADVKIRLGQHGDTCVDNAGKGAPYVLVSSVFEDGIYHVQPGQRVMFQHGSVREVVDNEKEPCGCPPDQPKGNEFPLAQSEGMAPLAKPAAAQPGAPEGSGQVAETLNYSGVDKSPQTAAAPPAPPAQPAANRKKSGFFSGLGRFFRKIFGAGE